MGNLKPVFSQNSSTTFVHPPASGSSFHTANILYNPRVLKQLTGVSGVVKQGLVHLAIPNGWSWGGPASHYCPIYVELFANSSNDVVALWYLVLFSLVLAIFDHVTETILEYWWSLEKFIFIMKK